MRQLSKAWGQEILKTRLRLRSPRFSLRKWDNMVGGSVISETFRGKCDHERQRMLRDAVEAELGDDADQLVGTLLAYTAEEWDIDLVAFSNGRRESSAPNRCNAPPHRPCTQKRAQLRQMT